MINKIMEVSSCRTIEKKTKKMEREKKNEIPCE